MTADMMMGLLRQVLPIIGTLGVTFGWIAPDAVGPLVAGVLSVAGPGVIFAGAVWAAVANSKSSIIASASKMPEVDSTRLASAIADPDLKAVAQKNG